MSCSGSFAAKRPGDRPVLEVWRADVNSAGFAEALRRLSNGGNTHAMFRLGRMYATGLGVAQNDSEAAALVSLGIGGRE